MRRASIANELAEELRRDVAGLTSAERVELALALGDESIERLAQRMDVSLDEARREHARQRQRGRRASGCIRALLE